MNDNKKKQTLQRRGALQQATVLCISAMAGCGTTAQQKKTEKTPTQQSQQAAPKADTAKKDAAKKEETKKGSDKKTSSNKPSGGQSSTSKPSGNQTGTNKPAGSQTGTSMPAGSQTGTNKPAGRQSDTNKPAGNQAGTNKPAGNQAGTNKPADSQSGTSKPADKKETPSIKEQPQSVKVAVGSSFTFKVSAMGANLKYTWQVDKNDGKGWTDIPDANESSYTVKNAGADQNGWKYRCVVSNDAGKAESVAATLSVDSSVKSKQG